MDRLTDVDQTRVEYWRAELKQRADDGDDDDFTDPRDRSNRDDVAFYQTGDGEWHPTALKRDDHVRIADVVNGVVVGPARDRRFVAIYNDTVFGDSPVWFEWVVVTDRAPADTSETPMPIVPSD